MMFYLFDLEFKKSLSPGTLSVFDVYKKVHHESAILARVIQLPIHGMVWSFALQVPTFYNTPMVISDIGVFEKNFL